MGKTKVLDINGNPIVGVFAYANDKFCLVGRSVSSDRKEVFNKALDVPVFDFTIAGSSQVGVFITGNSKKILVPSIITENEIAVLKSHNIDFAIIDTKLTALGNNLIVNDHYFFYNPEFEAKAVNEIKEALGLDGEPLAIRGWEVIGSIVAMNSKGGLVQNEVPEDIKILLEDMLKIPFERGTMNFGSRIISGCLVVNSFGMVVGNSSAGIEITNADLAFGFLEK
jgi:translation initiation factor 6